MAHHEGDQVDVPQTLPDDLDRALTTAADVESAGRSCVVIIAMVIVIVVLIGIWIVYTAS